MEEKPVTSGLVPTLEAFDIGVLLSSDPTYKGVDIAVLYPEGVTDKNRYQICFAETVAVNRGAKVRVFFSRDGVEEWLTVA